MKKLITLVLALALVLMMTVPALAAATQLTTGDTPVAVMNTSTEGYSASASVEPGINLVSPGIIQLKIGVPSATDQKIALELKSASTIGLATTNPNNDYAITLTNTSVGSVGKPIGEGFSGRLTVKASISAYSDTNFAVEFGTCTDWSGTTDKTKTIAQTTPDSSLSVKFTIKDTGTIAYSGTAPSSVTAATVTLAITPEVNS